MNGRHQTGPPPRWLPGDGPLRHGSIGRTTELNIALGRGARGSPTAAGSVGKPYTGGQTRRVRRRFQAEGEGVHGAVTAGPRRPSPRRVARGLP
jgi:hypothetical protein